MSKRLTCGEVGYLKNSNPYQELRFWIYGGLMAVDNVPPFVEPKGCTVDQWHKEYYKKWLKVRGEPTEGDKDLRKGESYELPKTSG
jgi:hypothetical protein